MKLIVVHGVPGVGKYTIGREVAQRSGYRFLHYHSLGMFFGPLFGFGTPEFAELRDRFYADVLRMAARSEVDGIVSTLLFEPTLSLPWLTGLWDEVGAEVFWVGLTCARSEHKRRVEERRRGQMGGIDDFDFLENQQRAGMFVSPSLPGPTIDTTHRTVDEAVTAVIDAMPAGW